MPLSDEQNKKPHWWPMPVGPDTAARLRDDYPEDKHQSDEWLFERYGYEGHKYQDAALWDHTGDAERDYDNVADALIKADAEIAALRATVAWECARCGGKWSKPSVHATAIEGSDLCDSCACLHEQNQISETLSARVAELEAANAKAFQVRGMCHYCKTTIYYRDAMADVDGKTFHPICGLTNQIESLTAENARLAGVVAKLPITKDGVPVAPGDTVFGISGGDNLVHPMETDSYLLARMRYRTYDDRTVDRCYSTLAAAEAARAKGGA